MSGVTSPESLPRADPPRGPVLVLSASAGDEVAGCGGALLWHRAQGDSIRVALFASPDSAVAGSPQAAGLSSGPVPEVLHVDLQYGEALVQAIEAALGAAVTVYAPAPDTASPRHQALALAAAEALRRVGGEVRLALYDVSAQGGARPFPLATGEELRGRARRGAYALAAAEPPAAAPLVSIVMRTLGRDSLQVAADSVAAQTWAAIELVVVDAAGVGLSAPFCGRFPVRVCGSGVPLARAVAANVGLRAAAGRFVMLLDDDDWIHPDHVAKLAFALADERLGRAAYTGVEAIALDQDGARAVETWDAPFDPWRLLYENYVPVHAMLFDRALIAEGCLFDETLPVLEDWDFWRQLAGRTAIRHVPGVSAAYRMPGASGVGDPRAPQVRDAVARIVERWASGLQPAQVATLLRALHDRDLHAFEDLRGQLAGTRRAWDLALDEARARESEWEAERASWRIDRRELEAARDGWQAEAAAQQAARAASEAHASTLAAAILEREGRIRELLSSLSWRLTAPLRRLHERLTGQRSPESR